MMDWQNLRQGKGQSVQDYTQEFRKRTLVLGIPLYTQKIILSYKGGFHSYLRHMILMFNPTNLDEVCVQATHIEIEGMENKSKGKGKGKHTTTVKKEGEKPTCTHCQKKKFIMLPNVGNFIRSSSLRSFRIKKTKRVLQQQSNMIWGQTLGMKLRWFLQAFKVKYLLVLFQEMNMSLMKERGVSYFILE